MRTGLDRKTLTAAEYQRAYVAERKRQMEAGEVTPPHGTINTYANYGCRCAECRAAKLEYGRRLRRGES